MADERRGAIDVARSVALLVVVLGHLLLAVVDVDAGGRVRGENLLALRPTWAWAAAFAPMPLFFAAAGYANATVPLSRAAPRLRTLVGVASVVVIVWSVAVVAGEALGGAGVVGDGARLATQPLWFLAAYLPLAAVAPAIGRVAERWVLPAGLAILTLLAAGDLVRFSTDGWGAIGWPGFFLAWGLPWMLGSWWRARAGGWRGSGRERMAGAVLLVSGLAGAAVLVRFFGYRAALIDVGTGGRSNTTPPSLYTAVAGVAQVGALMLAAPALDGAARRWRRIVDALGRVSVGVYVWHLSALALAAGLVQLLHLPLPRRLTAGWWALRPVWLAVVLAIATLLVLATETVRGRMRRRSYGGGGVPAYTSFAAAAAGVVVAAAGAALVGLRGPRSATLAVACAVAFAAGWLLLATSEAGRAPRSGSATPSDRAPSTGRRSRPPTGRPRSRTRSR